MRAVYIGILTPGSTSRMRAECLRRLTPDWDWQWIDTDPPMQESSRLWKTMAFRFNTGKVVEAINDLVMKNAARLNADLAWIDKAVFLYPPTIRRIRQSAGRMVHYTPDTAFHANRSRHFETTVGMFDVAVTTKSFEVPEYRRRIPEDRILLTTQGYDPTVHYPRGEHEQRRKEVAFAGLAEPDRERCIATLLQHGIPVRLAGRGWTSFVSRWAAHPGLTYAGADVFGSDYAELLSRSWIGLGLLSKRFPELHTTRTFEIPACAAILATEATMETTEYFNDSEAIFFEDYSALANRIGELFSKASDAELRKIALAGLRRVESDGRDYPSILRKILTDARLVDPRSPSDSLP